MAIMAANNALVLVHALHAGACVAGVAGACEAADGIGARCIGVAAPASS